MGKKDHTRNEQSAVIDSRLVQTPPSSNQEPIMREYPKADWLWSATDRSPEVMLSTNYKAAFFHTDPVEGSTGTAGVRGTQGFVDGEHYWEIRFLEPPHGTSVMVGVATKNAALHTGNSKYINLIGMDGESWGLSYKGTRWHGGQQYPFCQPFYDEDTVIGVHLNLYMGTLAFYKNGQYMGIAFTGLNRVQEALYPVISSTATNTELELEKCTCRYLSLQEKCFLKVARQIHSQRDVQQLCLPHSFKHQLRAMIST